MMLQDLVFVGFNSRVAALNRDTGEVVWNWKSPRGSGYVTVFLDGDRLIVSVVGYTYCLDPKTGGQLWSNPLEGYGTGVASIASVNGATSPVAEAAEEIARRRSQASAASAPHIP